MNLTTSPNYFSVATFGPYDWSSYDNLVTLTTAKVKATKNAEIAGIRYRNLNRTDGICYMQGGVGGYAYQSYISIFPNIGPWLAAMSIDVLYIELGGNDAFGFGVTAAQYYLDVQSYLNTLRASLPNTVFIVDAGPYRANGGEAGYSTYLAEYNQYAGALAALVTTYTNVLAFNIRRFSEEKGWNAQSENYYYPTPSAWSALTTYAEGDAVSYNSLTYVSRLGSNLNNTPSVYTTDWWTTVHTRLADVVHQTEFGCQEYANAIRYCIDEILQVGRSASSYVH